VVGLHYWDELIGPGPPPVKTREGWLLVYYGAADTSVGLATATVGDLLAACDD
jgi:predicted GH43/DUF377 family glycosyl hydrolase